MMVSVVDANIEPDASRKALDVDGRGHKRGHLCWQF